MADLLYAELDVPEPGAGWWPQLAALAHSVRRVLPRIPRPRRYSPARSRARTLSGSAGRCSARFAAPAYPAEAEELHEQLTEMVFALVRPELHPEPKRHPGRDAAFERGIELVHAGLLARLEQQPALPDLAMPGTGAGEHPGPAAPDS